MACDIRKYKSMDIADMGHRMVLTAFVGFNGSRSVQFTLDGKYCALSEDAIIDLIETLTKRLKCEDGYTATGDERKDIEWEEK